MEKKKGSGGTAGAMAGKGFYIVLFLCAAAIGASAWILSAGTHVEDMEEAVRTVDISEAVVTMLPAGTPMEKDGDVIETMAEQDAEPAEAGQTESSEDDETAAAFSEVETAFVWPVQGTVEVPYAVETLRYDATMADWRTHAGIDIACEAGEPVLAVSSGTVASVASDDLYGTTVEIDHGNGLRSVYANLASEPPVWEGEAVSTGDIIGSVGGTAIAESNVVPHLHLAMKRDGGYVDPADILPAPLPEE